MAALPRAIFGGAYNMQGWILVLSGEFVISSVLSRCTKNLKRGTNGCYSSVLLGKTKDSTPSRSEGRQTQKTKRRKASILLGFLLLYICLLTSLPPTPATSLPSVNWASQEGCLCYLRSSLGSSDLPLFYFLGLFPSLSFSHLHFGLLFSILPT